jgi:hypothetical protein
MFACVWQVDVGSQVSPGSTTELPQTAVQLLSLAALHPAGQQASPLAHVVIVVVFTQVAVQAAAVPCSARSWQPTAGQAVGQLPSQVSEQAGSTTPLPQRQAQSLSLTLVQPDGQQPSPFVQAPMTVLFTQAAVQAAADPCSVRSWQPIAGHDDGQLPSHVSPASTAPLPQRGAQSLSLLALQPDGQQPSPFAQAVCAPSSTQAAVQAAADPDRRRRAQPIQGHAVGQLCGGSQVSPLSIMPLPQRGRQSTSCPAPQLPPAQGAQAVGQ